LLARMSTNFVYTVSDNSDENLKRIQDAYFNFVDVNGIANQEHKSHPELIKSTPDVSLVYSANVKQPFSLDYKHTDASKPNSFPITADSVYILTPSHFKLTEEDVIDGPTDPRMERPTILLHNYNLSIRDDLDTCENYLDEIVNLDIQDVIEDICDN
jgi:hypothetical protein